MGLMQFVNAADFAQYRAREFEAVVDCRGLRQVEQHLLQRRIVDVDVDAANQVGLILLFREPACRRRRGAAFRQREHRRAACMWLYECVRVNRDEQIGLHLAGLDHAIGERHVVVAVADQDAAHVRFRIHQRLEFPGHRQCHVFLVSTAAALRPRIFATVAGIDCNGDEPYDFGLRRCWFFRGFRIGRCRVGYGCGFIGRRWRPCGWRRGHRGGLVVFE